MNNLFSQVQWQSIVSPVSEDLNSVWVLEAGHFIIISEQGTIISTTNGGETWQTVDFPGYHLKSIYFTDGEHGFICGDGSEAIFISTTNGGETWQFNSFDELTLTHANGIYFTNSVTGFIVGSLDNHNRCFKTLNGGLFWEQPSYPVVLESVFHGIHFRDSLSGNMVGTDGVFYTTINGGENWNMDIGFPAIDLNAVYNFGDQTGVAVGNLGTAYYTINRWSQHIDLTTNVTVDLNAVWGADGTNKLWAVGDEGTILVMENYLLGWGGQVSGTTDNLNDVFIMNENYGVAVGDNGTILVMSDINSLDETDYRNGISIFPNPSSDKTTIRVDLATEATIELRVFDVCGKEVAVLYKGRMRPGSNDLVFDASELTEGVYFTRFNSDGFREVKKLVIRH